MNTQNYLANNSGFIPNKVQLSEMKDIQIKKIIIIGDGMSGKTQIILTLSQIIIEYLNEIYSANRGSKLQPFEESVLRHAEAVLNQDSNEISTEFINWAENHGFLVQYGRVKWNVGSTISLDTEMFRAEVILAIDKKENNLPIDTSAKILTAGLIGANYISLVPGFEEEFLQEGGQIIETQSALVLENLIGQFIYRLDDEKEEKSK